MDFFARQDASRRSTKRLVLLFGLAFLAVAIASGIVVTIVVAFAGAGDGVLSTTAAGNLAVAERWPLFAGVIGGTLALMFLASLYRSATLSKGGGQIARTLGGTQIHGDEADPIYRRLTNVVEEMSIASGVPVPEIYVLEQESGINAFAAGLGHADAAVAVTRGSLDQLSRAELRGVIAHEFSHILNGDMRLNLRLIGFAYGILVLSLIGRWLLRGARISRSSGSRNNGGGIAVIGVALLVIGGIGVLFSRLIKAAVSRQREVLADASAVQFTREPMALAGALKKIGGFTPHLNGADTEEVAHMLFGRGAPSLRGWFATHPPLHERILALDPSFRGEDYPQPRTPAPVIPRDDHLAGTSGLTDTPVLDDVTVGAAGSIRNDRTGEILHAAIPEALLESAHSVEDSVLLVVAVALAGDTAATGRRLAIVDARLGRQRSVRCLRLVRELDALDRRLWLPLVEIAIPALKRRPEAQLQYLLDLLARLRDADSVTSLFEYVLARLLTAYLLPEPAPRRHSRGTLRAAQHAVIAAVAYHGHSSKDGAAAAFRAGADRLPGAHAGQGSRPLEDGAAGSLQHFDTALGLLAASPLESRRLTLEAMERVIRHDGAIQIEEAEMLRAVAATLGCPIPPASALH